MKIVYPSAVKIGAHTYSVTKPYQFRERADMFGQCDNALHEIRIAGVDGGGSVRPSSAVLQTFFHELLHSIDSVYMDGKIHQLGSSESELIINQLAEGLTQVLLDGNLPRIEKETKGAMNNDV